MSMRRLMNLVENAAAQTPTLFHGTSVENAFSILSGGAFHGFPDRGIGTDAGVSFTTDFHIAERFAEGAYHGDDGIPVVIAVDKLRLEHDGHRVVQWVRPDGLGRDEQEWRALGTSIPTTAVTAVYINGRHHSPAEAPEALRKTLLSDFLGSLTPDDTGREIVGGMVVRFEGFTDYCQQDALDRCAPRIVRRHLPSFEAVYDEILAQWKQEEGQEPAEHGFVGDDDYPILWASFEQPRKIIAEGQGKPFITIETEWETVQVWTNPTAMMANRLLENFPHGGRGLVYPDIVLLWDAAQAIHSDIAHGFRPDAEWAGFAVVPQGDDLVVGEYEDDKPSWITKNGYLVYSFADDQTRVQRLFPKVKQTVTEAASEFPLRNGWWVLPDGRVVECPTLGSHASTAQQLLDKPSSQPVVTMKKLGGIRCAVFWTPASPATLNIDLDPSAVTQASKRGLLSLMARYRDFFEGYFFEHVWTEQQDNKQRSYREAVAEVRGLAITESVDKLCEMPINKWEVSSQFDANHDAMQRHPDREHRPASFDHYSKADRAAIRDQGIIRRARLAYESMPFKINLFFYHHPEMDYDPILQQGSVDFEFIERVMGQHVADEIRRWYEDDAVNVVMTNNLSDEHRISLRSPWMLGHRMIHAIAQGSNKALTDRNYSLNLILAGFIEDVTKHGYGFNWNFGYFGGYNMHAEHIHIIGPELGKALSTMKSARSGIMVNVNDWASEMFTQWMITGRVTFKPLPPVFDERPLTTDPKKLKKVENIMRLAPKRFDRVFRSIMQNAVGKIWVM